MRPNKAKAILTIRLVTIAVCFFSSFTTANGQTTPIYKAPQDTIKVSRKKDETLSVIKTKTVSVDQDSRLKGIAVSAAETLNDTARYNTAIGIALQQLLKKDDLDYVGKKGINTVVAFFELVNKYLTKGTFLGFKSALSQEITFSENPLELKNLRAFVTGKPATIKGDKQQWKENVYQAYLARDYGTKLENTITITSATRELRESAGLKFIAADGREVLIKDLLQQQSAKGISSPAAEKAAVAAIRKLTYPNGSVSKTIANENYKRALFELMSLQEGDINRYLASKATLIKLNNDLRRGGKSIFVNALKTSTFFDANVPGNIGPVIVTDSELLGENVSAGNADSKAMELLMLLSLHYGERDAMKLIDQILSGTGQNDAAKAGIFSPARLNQLKFHGVEKYKSLGFGKDKTQNMTISDLVLVAVASPATPVKDNTVGYLTLQQAGQSVVNHYYHSTQITETRSVSIFSPRIKLGTRHTEYRAANDAVDFVPDLIGGKSSGQKGSRVVQNGIEVRLESDLYIYGLEKIAAKGVKPVFFPEFGIIAGVGNRSVGYDNSTRVGRHGAVPQFKNTVTTWGGHLGFNVGPFLISEDATIMSTKNNDDPYRRFFDLSSGMTYYRYSLLTHILNLGFGDIANGKGGVFTLDAELSAETNNEWYHDLTNTQNTAMQIDSKEWRRDFERSHPNGIFNQQIATDMILNGDAKAAYSASNLAALHLGYLKNGFHFTTSIGLYNLYAMPSDNNIGKIISNTAKGNLFGTVAIAYNFNAVTIFKKTRKKELYEIKNGVESPHTFEDSALDNKSHFLPRNRAIFTNKKAKLVSLPASTGGKQ